MSVAITRIVLGLWLAASAPAKESTCTAVYLGDEGLYAVVGGEAPVRVSGESWRSAHLSPDGKRIGAMRQNHIGFDEEDPRPWAEMKVFDLEGRLLKHIPVPWNGCYSYWGPFWLGDRGLAGEGHINPSTDCYWEWDMPSGRLRFSAVGTRFHRSPDLRHLVHFSWVPHFVDEPVQEYLVLAGAGPLYPSKTDRTFRSFYGSPVWAPEGRYVALHERAWRVPKDLWADEPRPLSTHLVVVDVERRRVAQRFPLPEAAGNEPFWISGTEVAVDARGTAAEGEERAVLVGRLGSRRLVERSWRPPAQKKDECAAPSTLCLDGAATCTPSLKLADCSCR